MFSEDHEGGDTANIHPVLHSVWRRFQDESIAWCLLRLPENLKSPTGDIDMLVSRGDWGRAAGLLKTQGFVPLAGRSDSSRAHYLHYDEGSDCILWLHLVSTVSFGPGHAIRTGTEDEVLTRRERIDVLSVVCPDDLFWALLLHCLLDKGTISARYQRVLSGLISDVRLDSPLARFVDELSGADRTAADLRDRVQRDDWDALEECAKALLALGLREDPKDLPSFIAKQGKRWRHLVRALRNPGISVALLGPDGAGKSTLSTSLQARCPVPARRAYMGMYHPWLTRLEAFHVPGLVGIARLALVWIRCAQGQYHRFRGQLVVYDRYTYDVFVPRGDRTHSIYSSVVARACPKPNLVFLLDVPGQVMFERKGRRKHTPEQLEADRRAYLDMRHRIPNLQVIDAVRPADAVYEEVTHRILRYYAER